MPRLFFARVNSIKEILVIGIYRVLWFCGFCCGLVGWSFESDKGPPGEESFRLNWATSRERVTENYLWMERIILGIWEATLPPMVRQSSGECFIGPMRWMP